MKNVISVLFLSLLFFPFLVRAEGVSIQQLEENATFDIDYAKWWQADSGGSNPYDPYYGSSQDYMSIVQTFVGAEDGFFTKVKFKADTNFLDDSLAPRQPNNWSGHVFSLCEGTFQTADFEAPIYGTTGCQYPYIEAHQYHIPEFKEMYDYTDGVYTIDLTGLNVTSTIGTNYYFVVSPPHYLDNQYGDTSRASVSLHWDNQYNNGESWYQYYVSIAGYVEVESALLGGDLWFQIWTDVSTWDGEPPTETKFLYPSNYETVPDQFDNFVATNGSCETVGANRIAITDTFIEYSELEIADFNEDCYMSNVFAYNDTYDIGVNKLFVWDISILEEGLTDYNHGAVTYYVQEFELGYYIDIFSPYTTTTGQYYLEPNSEFPININYRTEDVINDYFQILEYTDGTYTTLLTTEPVYIDTLENLELISDGLLDGWFWLENGLNIVDGVTRYLEFQLLTEDDTVRANFFSLFTGDNTGTTIDDITIPPSPTSFCDINPTDGWYEKGLKNVICWAVLGDYETRLFEIKEKAEHIKDDKIPTAYFFEIKNSFDSTATSSSMVLGINFNHLGLFDGTIAENINITFIDLANPEFSSIMWTIFIYIEETILPLLLTILIIFIVFKMFRKETH